MSEQEFGGIWTEKKLTIVEDYIASYIKIMKNQFFKLIYIDAFAGSGTTTTRNGQIIDGSPIY
jgi:three-Cys-motif partner protein